MKAVIRKEGGDGEGFGARRVHDRGVGTGRGGVGVERGRHWQSHGLRTYPPFGPSPHHSPNARSPADQIKMWASWRSSFVSPKCSLEAPLCWGESCESPFESSTSRSNGDITCTPLGPTCARCSRVVCIRACHPHPIPTQAYASRLSFIGLRLTSGQPGQVPVVKDNDSDNLIIKELGGGQNTNNNENRHRFVDMRRYA